MKPDRRMYCGPRERARHFLLEHITLELNFHQAVLENGQSDRTESFQSIRWGSLDVKSVKKNSCTPRDHQNLQWQTLYYAFSGCSNFTDANVDDP